MRSSKALPWLAAGYAVFAALILGLVAVDVEVLDLYRDPSELSEYLGDHPWKGGLSVVSVFLWSAAATAFFLTGAVLRAEDERAFFLTGGAVFLLLGLDDGLALHESMVSRVLGTDAAEKPVQALLALLALAWAVGFRRRILASEWPLLALAALGLGAGMVLDVRDRIGLDVSWGGLLEESIEFAGLVTLLVYAALEACRALARRRY